MSQNVSSIDLEKFIHVSEGSYPEQTTDCPGDNDWNYLTYIFN